MVEDGFLMDTSNATLCAPLQQLIDEHVSLRAEMDLFYDLTEEIEFDSGPAVIHQFVKLHQQVSAFTDKLKAHSKREEKGLFPLIVPHLKKNDRIIEEMEFEHEKAEKHLLDFLTEADELGPAINEDDAQAITVYAVQAYATLTQHFAKEEKVLFPLAEKLLSVDEKNELKRQLQSL